MQCWKKVKNELGGHQKLLETLKIHRECSLQVICHLNSSLSWCWSGVASTRKFLEFWIFSFSLNDNENAVKSSPTKVSIPSSLIKTIFEPVGLFLTVIFIILTRSNKLFNLKETA